ncbi:saccharopine dehydrogenase [Lactarius sanguifluus]|nr:saccharopine dehydrogenase [Lactarius sanguifluus]
MAPLSHPSIKDGWFREISSQWPGQAMTLKVNKILHVERSLYQDVLVFESETYGNVLVLDSVIQCTERDEFSYQEMIAHIPLASHPNPKKVLVIGGGDGGVVREVLKHETVEHVVLCDIDEAVVRVSKQYLPHMSALLESPKVKVFIGDGFKFLADNTSSYDVIITDSSDPVGPAASLFEKPYFQLLHDALTPGGNISTQAECLWLHLQLIGELRRTTLEVFETADYAFTTIPTYPSGQIGFLVCSTAQSRDLKTALRTVPNTRYYNSNVHKAAFVLPEFGRALIEEQKNITPPVGRASRALAEPNRPKKKVLLLGSGFVARPAAEYIARDHSNDLTIACRTLKSAEALADGLSGAKAKSLDVTDAPALEAAVAAVDVVVSLIPYIYHTSVIEAAIKGNTHVVTTSYVSPAIRALEKRVKAAGIVVMNEIGVDPGIDHLYAIKTIDEVHAQGGKEAADNPLGYKFSWSSRGVLLALLNAASWLADGQVRRVEGNDLMALAKPYYISPAYAFVAYPNRDSAPYREWYNIPEADTVVRGTAEFIRALVKLGWLDAQPKEWVKEGLTWAEATKRAAAALVSRVKEVCSFQDASEAVRVISGLRWIGLFSQEPVAPRAGNLLDTLCGRLEKLMAYAPGERDLVMLQHKFVVERADGTEQILTSTLEAYGAPGGHSAMALTVGVPCGIATQLVLDGVISTPGVLVPYSKEICDPLREQLEKEGIGMVERVL